MAGERANRDGDDDVARSRGPNLRHTTARSGSGPRGDRAQRGAALAMAVAAVGTLIVAIVGLRDDRRSADTDRQRVRLDQQGQFAERFARAYDRLGSDRAGVRIGGVHLFAQLIKDFPSEQPLVIEVLATYVRQQTQKLAPLPAPDGACDGGAPKCPPPACNDGTSLTDPLAADVQAALTTLGRRDAAHDSGHRIDLRRANLTGADLAGANLGRAHLAEAVLFNADLSGATLAGADLSETDLTTAILDRADLSGSLMASASLDYAQLAGANVRDANLRLAHLNNACLAGADVSGADLSNADLTGAELGGAVLRHATLRGVRGAQLANADTAGAVF
jgi:uncharacterized protein YjbI with pentapeptide repeats